jgi:hypothetical protein
VVIGGVTASQELDCDNNGPDPAFVQIDTSGVPAAFSIQDQFGSPIANGAFEAVPGNSSGNDILSAVFTPTAIESYSFSITWAACVSETQCGPAQAISITGTGT